MTRSKRIFDVLMAMVLIILLSPIIICISLAILIIDGRPVFFLSERMKDPSNRFVLVKFRTMKTVENDSGVSGGDKASRITRLGHLLRRTRMDELPQLFNVLKSDMSFVGPRPPLPVYVNRFPEIYTKVLKFRPGITGLASVYYHVHEEYLLSRCTNARETDEVYCRCCIPRKARIDLIYHKQSTLCSDFYLMFKTVLKKLR
jgi:lipopolysaccharide/colanic/teichoic acid biosynthesis glycosyltransferase